MDGRQHKQEPVIRILGYGSITPTYSLIVHPWVYILAGDANTIYIPPEACALLGTIIPSEAIPLDFPPKETSFVQVESVPDPPQPEYTGHSDEWSHLSNKEILFLLQDKLAVNHNDIIELGAEKIEQLCEKYHKLTACETRSLAISYIDRGLQNSSPVYIQGLRIVIRAISRSIDRSRRECSPHTRPSSTLTEQPDSTVQDDCSEQLTQTRTDKPVDQDRQVEHQ